ncbi:MAG TPA: DPP IV N-terminal domain-containing protein [Parasegetibacter sp.]
MKQLLSIILVLSFVTTSFAQKKQLTMEDAFLNARTTLAPENLRQLKWIKNSDYLSYVVRKNGVDILMKRAAIGSAESELVTLTTLNEAARNFDANLRFQAFPQVEWISETQFLFDIPGKQLRYDITAKTLTLHREKALPAGAENIDINPVKGQIAFTIKNNLYVSDGKTHTAVTSDTNEGIVNGQSVHRQEFGITKGTFWSPNGNLLAFYRMDETMVTDYPIIDWSAKPAKNVNIKYPMAGGKSHEVTLGVFNPSTRQTIYIETGEPKEQYLTNIAWSPDERYVYIAVLNRGQDHMKLNQYDATTGKFVKTIFEERDEKYTEPLQPMVFVPNKPNWFIWQSQRDGFNHLYLYDINGKLIRQLTKGEWVVTNFAGFDPRSEKAFFTSTINSPITRDFCSVSLADGKITRISSGTGTHTSFLNDKATMVLDHFSSTTVPRKWAVYNTSGKELSVVLEAANPLKDYQLGEMSIFTIKSNDNFDLYCRLYKPVNFDSTKKYPVIVYQYGGPHAQLINNTWNGGTGDLWFQHLAGKGYVVFTVDTRGSANRGKAFEQATFRRLGEAEMEDQLAGVKYLKSLPYVDASRIGLIGWSYGGFMTTSLMVKHPGVYKVAVAGGPVMDWSFYEIMYTERYMDTPQENPDGYKNSTLANFVDNLKGRLLLIHGTQDNVVVWQHSIMFVKEAVTKGKLIDYMIYPGYEHNVGGKDRVHLFNTITRYFDDHL